MTISNTSSRGSQKKKLPTKTQWPLTAFPFVGHGTTFYEDGWGRAVLSRPEE